MNEPGPLAILHYDMLLIAAHCFYVLSYCSEWIFCFGFFSASSFSFVYAFFTGIVIPWIPRALRAMHFISSLFYVLVAAFFLYANLFTQMNSLDLFILLSLSRFKHCISQEKQKKSDSCSEAMQKRTLNKYITCSDGKLASSTKWDFIFCSHWV